MAAENRSETPHGLHTVVGLAPAEREKKVACPFLGSAVATGQLPVLNDPANPLASIQDVIDLGNEGGGDLGKVLGFFAKGNHGKMRGPLGHLDTPIPSASGLFSLELPGSQGSHAGHSGILQGDPAQLDSGRFSQNDFDRLANRSQGGFIRRSDIADFIAENIARDPNSETLAVARWIKEAFGVAEGALERVAHHPEGTSEDNELQESLAHLAGSNHLVASAGEFGLLLAFLHNSPRTRQGDDPAFLIDEIAAMFRHQKLPDDWRTWEKTARDWIRHTVHLVIGAARELVRMQFVRLPIRGARELLSFFQ
jgi:hypothetical protein